MDEETWKRYDKLTEPGDYVVSWLQGKFELHRVPLNSKDWAETHGTLFLGPIKGPVIMPEKIQPRWGLFQYETGAIKSLILTGADTKRSSGQKLSDAWTIRPQW